MATEMFLGCGEDSNRFGQLEHRINKNCFLLWNSVRDSSTFYSAVFLLCSYYPGQAVKNILVLAPVAFVSFQPCQTKQQANQYVAVSSVVPVRGDFPDQMKRSVSTRLTCMPTRLQMTTEPLCTARVHSVQSWRSHTLHQVDFDVGLILTFWATLCSSSVTVCLFKSLKTVGFCGFLQG